MGATLGFVVLLVVTGFGLHEMLQQYPVLAEIVRWSGLAFLIYLVLKLAVDDGHLEVDKPAPQPSLHAVAHPQRVAGMGAS
jgi:threonine/homoserine/homoserine lactone efflux protein